MSDFKKEVFEWIKTIIVAFAIAFAINIFGGIAVVDGQSMNPTLNNKDMLILDKISYKTHSPNRGDVVAFKTDLEFPEGIWKDMGMKKNLVKRIIGLPGDAIRVKDGEVYVNGQKREEDYIADGTTDGEIDTIVPEGHLFVMGDNRLFSNDSRREAVGFVKIDKVIGRVTVRLFPFNAIGHI